eukprot:3926108-Amphidinium_carterae.1
MPGFAWTAAHSHRMDSGRSARGRRFLCKVKALCTNAAPCTSCVAMRASNLLSDQEETALGSQQSDAPTADPEITKLHHGVELA